MLLKSQLCYYIHSSYIIICTVKEWDLLSLISLAKFKYLYLSIYIYSFHEPRFILVYYMAI